MGSGFVEEIWKDREEGSEISWQDPIGLERFVIIKTNLQLYNGMRVNLLKSQYRFIVREIIKDLFDLFISVLWKVMVWCGFQYFHSVIHFGDTIFKINFGRSGTYEGNSLIGNTVYWIGYKKERTYGLFFITFITFSHHQCIKAFSLFFASLMAQSQLIGKNGDLKNGEGTRKRLRISVPHFDNSHIIKNYARTLVGRCMNPKEQNMAALVTNLPKIWNLEDRVVGADLGHGKFQFDFDKEEDIEELLKNQPYHFDYWMLSLARWQPKKSHNYPSDIPFWIRVVGVPLDY